jgi:hypothetical protein
MEGFTGVIVSDFKVTVTVSEAVALTGPPAVLNVAEMLEVPRPRPSASPLELIVAAAVFDELQITRPVTSLVVPSL